MYTLKMLISKSDKIVSLIQSINNHLAKGGKITDQACQDAQKQLEKLLIAERTDFKSLPYQTQNEYLNSFETILNRLGIRPDKLGTIRIKNKLVENREIHTTIYPRMSIRELKINGIPDSIATQSMNGEAIPIFPTVKDIVFAKYYVDAFRILNEKISSLDITPSSNKEVAEEFISSLHAQLREAKLKATTQSPFFEILFTTFGDDIPPIDINNIPNHIAHTFYSKIDLTPYLAAPFEDAKKQFLKFFGKDATIVIPHNPKDIFNLLYCITIFQLTTSHMSEKFLNNLCFLLEGGITVGIHKFDATSIINEITKNYQEEKKHNTK